MKLSHVAPSLLHLFLYVFVSLCRGFRGKVMLNQFTAVWEGLSRRGDFLRTSNFVDNITMVLAVVLLDSVECALSDTVDGLERG